jgi:hypothetical protein
METTMKSILAAALLVNLAAATVGFAEERCNVPVADWQPREALQTKLKAGGWQVRSIKTEDGCYEAYAVDAKGEKVEAYFNPQTLERVGAAVDEDSEG